MPNIHRACVVALSILTICTGTQAYAQSTRNTKPIYPGLPTVKGVPAAAQPRFQAVGIDIPAAKTTNVPSRLVADAIHYPDGAGGWNPVPSDTSDYVYSGKRGGDGTESNPLKYDTALMRKWDGAAGVFIPNLRYLQTFNATNQLLSQEINSYSGAYWDKVELDTWKYTAAGKDSIDAVYYWDSAAGAWSPWSRKTTTYNSVGLPDVSVFEGLDFNTNKLELSTRDSFAYTGAGLVRLALHQRWDTGAKAWWMSDKEMMTYTPGNQLKTYVTLSAFIGMPLDTDYTAFYYYNGSNFLTGRRTKNYGTHDVDSALFAPLNAAGQPLTATVYSFDGTNWNPSGRELYTYTASGKVSLLTNQSYDLGVWGNFYRWHYFYNSFDQCTRQHTMTFYNSVWDIVTGYDVDLRNYYAQYDNGVSGPEGGNMPSVVLSPIPVKDELRVLISCKTPGTFVTTVFDATGRVMQQWSSRGAVSQLRMDVSGFAAGQYYLSVKNEGGVVARPFTVRH